ncbi:MAG: hypothetical protein JXA33_15865 [Anaerolineae bacterium]|nr:hypothetical protein [Anaerolineae bacterium]
MADPKSGRIDPAANPLITDMEGYYGWNVAEGCWYVVVAKDGYETLVSPVVGVPPEVTDLDLELRSLLQQLKLLPEAGITFMPDHAVQAQPGTILTFTHTLTNTGDITDTYHLVGYHNQDWAFNLFTPDWPQGTLHLWLFEVGPQATRIFTVSVTVPVEVISGTVGTTIITATSYLDPSVFAAVADAVTVYTVPVTPPQAGVAFAPDHNVSAQSGEVLTFTHTLTNTGTAIDTFDLLYTGDWGELLTASPVTLLLA